MTDKNTQTQINKEELGAEELSEFYDYIVEDDADGLKPYLLKEKFLKELTEIGDKIIRQMKWLFVSGETNILNLMLEKGVSAQKIMESVLNQSNSAFNHNLHEKNMEPLKILLRNGASGQTLINALSTYESNLWIVFFEENEELIRLLLESGANADKLNEVSFNNGNKGVYKSFLKGNLQIAKLLLEYGADPIKLVEPGEDGRSALSPILNNTDINRQEKLDFLKQLLDEGVSVNYISEDLNLRDPLIVGLLRKYKIKNAKKFKGEKGDVTFAQLKEQIIKNSWTATNNDEVMKFDFTDKYEMSATKTDQKTKKKIKEKSFTLPNAIHWDNLKNKGIKDYKYKGASVSLELIYDIYNLYKLPYYYTCNYGNINPLKFEKTLRKYISQEDGEKYDVWKDLEEWRDGSWPLEEANSFYMGVIEPYIINTLDFELLAELLKEMNELEGGLKIPEGFSMVSPFKLDIMKDYEIENKSDFWSVFCEIASHKDWQELKDISIRSII